MSESKKPSGFIDSMLSLTKLAAHLKAALGDLRQTFIALAIASPGRNDPDLSAV
jgi:hypothetical protein